MSTQHNPLNFEPKDYAVEDYLDNQRPQYCGGSVEAYAADVKWWEADMERTFGALWRSMIHRCVHCGNGTVRWITAVRYLPTDAVVVFGAVCTERLGFANRHAFKLAQLQAKAEARKVRFTIYNKRQEYLAAHPEVTAALARIDDPVHAKNTFAKDVLSKLDRWGSLSDAQAAAVVKSLDRDVEFAARRTAEDLIPKGPAPSGRAVVTGTVLSMKWIENGFGMAHKMLVKLENNSRVWVTVPGKETIERGDAITIRATWSPSNDDPSFGFGSRPFLLNRVPMQVEPTEDAEAIAALDDMPERMAVAAPSAATETMRMEW